MENSNGKKEPPYEIVLQYSWSCIPQKTKLQTVDECEVVVLFPGQWNFEEGPDFKSARISIANTVVTGDVEIHRFSKDWIEHGHHKNRKYDNVILHVIGSHTRSGLFGDKYPPVPTVILPNKFIKRLSKDKMQKYPYGYCASKFDKFSDDILSNFFSEAGEKRFIEKVSLITKDILRDGVEKAFFRSIFDSCGYKKNRQEFIELFNRFFEYDVDSFSQEEAIAVLWGESGLLPDPGSNELSGEMKKFVEGIWHGWWKFRKGTRERIIWRFSGVRPLNNPYRRLAAVSAFISKFGLKPFFTMLEEFRKVPSSLDVWKKFKKLLVCTDSLWDYYSVPSHRLTKGAAVLGETRGLDIMVNVVLPFIYAHGSVHSLDMIKEKALQAWKSLPTSQSNILLKVCAHRWLIPHERALAVFNSSAAQQGAMFIHKKFCESEQMNCANCPVYSLLSNYS